MSLFYLTSLLHLNCKSVVTKNGYKPLAINQLSSKKNLSHSKRFAKVQLRNN